MKHGSLFSGIGGFDLAAEWMGWENMFHCEWNEFGQRILKHYWPNAKSYGDITKTDFTIWRGKIDILTGGFPCQPYSNAGKRKGKEDDRHLWPEMLRAIREISPRWIVGENVRGLTNWNGGLVFDEVQADLEAEGYEVLPFLLPACGVNAPHRRDRIWFVAYAESSNRNVPEKSGRVNRSNLVRNAKEGVAAYPSRQRLSVTSCGEQRNILNQAGTHKRGEFGRAFTKSAGWESFPTQSPVCSGNDGLSRELDGITFSKWRNESIKGYGNAIVPQIVHNLFKAIQAYENMQSL